MMNYDGLLAQLTDEKLQLFQDHSTPGNASSSGSTHVGVIIEDGAVEEEPIATIQNVPFPLSRTPSGVVPPAKSETSTPQRKISTSSRFMNAFTQFYTGATSSNTPATTSSSTTAAIPTTTTSTAATTAAASAADSTPTKNGMETKLLSMWHNVKYGWSGKLKSNFSKEQPVWMLGRCYHRKSTPPSSMESSAELTTITSADLDNKDVSLASNAYGSIKPIVPNSSGLYPTLNPLQVDEIVVPQELGMDAAENQVAENPWEEGIEGFRRDFYSRVWMTYRREFPTMNGTNYTSDCGWGCMLRSGQMLLAQGLICHFLGRSWRFDPDTQLHSTLEDNMHKKIIKWFGDSSSRSSPFSIHALVNLGEQMGKKPGDWYGPASVSFLLKQALKNAAQENADFDNITIYVARDCTIYMQDVEELCRIPEPSPKKHVPWQTTRKAETTPKSERQHWKSLIILIPLRLGTDKLNAVYAHCLKLLLSTEYCIGIIGGRPKHSLYFVGFQEDKLIHLDPHYCQEMVDVNQENFSVQSFHCKSPRKLKTTKMDPSCCIGFYCQTKADFDNFVESVQLYLHPMRCASGAATDKTAASTTPSQSHSTSTSNCDATTNATTTEMNYPLFTFSRGHCLYNSDRNEMSDSLYKPLQQLMQINNHQTSAAATGTGTSSHQGQRTADAADISLWQCHNTISYDDDDGETEEFVLL